MARYTTIDQQTFVMSSLLFALGTLDPVAFRSVSAFLAAWMRCW
jgi:hypothetical protein